ncbi:MAG: flagellar export protein FliJ [Caryophanon sp.]|nr:flagellar export protein FliJ [Caryophanon sp.]
MKYAYRFEQILTVREQEKNETEQAYKASVQAFEEVATKLYELLRKKEALLAYQTERLQHGSTIEEIHQNARFLDSLEKMVDTVQQKVVQARAKMSWYEERLLEKNLEVRKYEKMKERDFEQFQQEQLRVEAIFLDELSTLTFNKKEIR